MFDIKMAAKLWSFAPASDKHQQTSKLRMFFQGPVPEGAFANYAHGVAHTRDAASNSAGGKVRKQDQEPCTLTVVAQAAEGESEKLVAQAASVTSLKFVGGKEGPEFELGVEFLATEAEVGFCWRRYRHQCQVTLKREQATIEGTS